jgi:BsuBI/PstI restriction endonuclease
MPKAQRNERSALCLLALLDLAPNKSWNEARSPLIGITPIMDWMKAKYRKEYAPNSRETVRRQTIHQFVQANIAVYNPDKPNRAINSGDTVYQIEPSCLELLKSFGTRDYARKLEEYLAARPTLSQRYAMQRKSELVSLQLPEGKEIRFSPGAHSELIRDIVVQFGPRFVPGGRLVYAGDTGDKFGFFDQAILKSLGVIVDSHGKMPDVVIHYPEKGWLVLAEAVTSHGPVDAKRHQELKALFSASTAGLVFVSAFPTRKVFLKYLEHISWETEVWIADQPSHLIHFNGARFLGPYVD